MLVGPGYQLPEPDPAKAPRVHGALSEPSALAVPALPDPPVAG
jgi:hypothetical protein